MRKKVLVFDLSIAWIYGGVFSQCATQLHRPILWIAGIRKHALAMLEYFNKPAKYTGNYLFVCLCFFACEPKDSSCTVHTVNVCARGKWISRLVDAPNIIGFMHANAHIWPYFAFDLVVNWRRDQHKIPSSFYFMLSVVAVVVNAYSSTCDQWTVNSRTFSFGV